MANALWYSTPTTPLDVMGSLAVNMCASNMAATNPKLRWIPFGQGDNVWMDGRFLGGMGALAAGFMGTGNVARVGVDVAQGLLGSLIATEAVRSQCVALQQTTSMGQAAWGTPAPTMMGAHAAPQLAPPPPAPMSDAIQQAAQAARASGYPGSYA